MFFKLTAVGPSDMFPEHLLHGVQCTASDQSQKALRAENKLVKITAQMEGPKYVSQALCSASLSALLKKAAFAQNQLEKYRAR